MKNLYNYQLKENVILKNRLVLAPMTSYSGNPDLTLSESEEIYYRARGEQFGMVVTAATAVSKHAQAFPNQISIKDDSYLSSMKRLADAIKAGGALAVLQLHHGGRMNRPGLYENQDIVSASAVKALRDYTVVPRALTTEEVYEVIDDFRQAVIRAIKAGFDGIELHGANTYLIQQFFSPHSNQRTDEFGGTPEKRLTFAMKLVDAAIAAKDDYANEDFIIGYRLSPEELEEPGITLDDTALLVSELSKKPIDYIHFSLGSYKQSSMRNKEDKRPIIEKLRQVNVGKKILIGVGGVENKIQIEEGLSMGYDLMAVGLASLADVKVVDHILNGEPIKKVFDESSLLPANMYLSAQKRSNVAPRGYTFK